MADGSARGTVERVEPTKAQRAAARKVAESKATIPHLYVRGTLDIGSGEDFLPAVVWATARALLEAPRLNGSYRDGVYEAYSRVNVGVVADGADGLVVPTIFDVDSKDVGQIKSELEALTAKALNAEITAREIAGGTFTIATGFGYDGCDFLPVINAGQAANLGIGSPSRGAISATVAADARMISGAEAGAFLKLTQAALKKRTEPE